MKTELELNKIILKTIMNIGEKFPELSKYIEEMPITIPNEITPQINITVLEDYQESLNSLLKKYTITHQV